MKRILCLLLLAACLGSTAADLYVDFDNGSDSNSGLSTNAPLKTIPGTWNTNGTAYAQSTWGGIDSGHRVASGVTIWLKRGTTYDRTKGGGIQCIAGDYYGPHPASWVTFEVMTNWGTGRTVMDGLGVTTPISYWLLKDDNFRIIGHDLLTIQNTDKGGVYLKEQGSGAAQTNASITGVYFYNCGSSYASSGGAAEGTVMIRKVEGGTNVLLSSLEVNHNGSKIGAGIHFGDANMGANVAPGTVPGWVIGCTVYGGLGETAGNDYGIGFKGQNANIIWSNCISTNNLKGWDIGWKKDWGSNFQSTVINSTASSNYWGIVMNNAALTGYWTNPPTFQVINTLMLSNASHGWRGYSGPFTVSAVGNVFDWNAGGDTEGAHLRVTPDTVNDTNLITMHLYNNIFVNCKGPRDILVYFASPSTRQTLDMDYNVYSQGGSEYFASYGVFGGGLSQNYSFGADGPGHASGEWYTEYQNSTSNQFTNSSPGTGHFHADAHSKGTGADDSLIPGLNIDYTLSGHLYGTNLSSMSWYSTMMGSDRRGLTRTNWDMGMYEFTNAPAPVYSYSYTNSSAITISDNTVGSPYPSTITVAGVFATVTNVSVTLSNVWHTHAQDIRALLVSPNSITNVVLMADAPNIAEGGASGASYSFTNSQTLTIPTSGVTTPVYPSTNVVSGVSGTVTNITVTFPNFYHTFPNDLDIFLKDPDGYFVLMYNRDSQGTAIANGQITFNDYASTAMPVSPTALTSGTYRNTVRTNATTAQVTNPPAPYNFYFTNLVSHTMNGNWMLYVYDGSSGDGGSVSNGWYMTINTSGSGAQSTPITGATIKFSDLASSAIGTNQISSGSYKPSNYTTNGTLTAPAPQQPYGALLSVFTNQTINGDWSLYVMDDTVTNSGAISNGWSISFLTSDVSRTNTSASTNTMSKIRRDRSPNRRILQ